MRKLFGLLVIALTVLPALNGLASAQDDAEPTPPPPVTANAGWEPVTQEINGMDWVLVPPGCFMMGASEGEFSDMDEEPVHEQCIDSAFWLQKTEVTRVQYAECVAADGCEPVPDSMYSKEDNQPINRVNWYQAGDYCAWIGGRLPTEPEWEYAARGPDNLRYPWGDQFVMDYVVVSGNHTSTAEVGSVPEGASWAGALDMGGNVFEWVSSRYESYPYDPAIAEDPDSESNLRIWRGGSFLYDDDVRGANREVWKADKGNDEVGIRCAMDLPPAE